LAAIAAVTTAGCALLPSSADATSKTPSAVMVVQGADQSAQAGKDLPTPIVFRVVDSTGAGMPRITVSLSVAAGGGAVTPVSDTTDAHGEVSAKWTLGPSVVDQSIQATVPGVAAAPVHATGILPAQIVVAQGNNQSAKTGSALPNSVIIRVVGVGNVPMQGVTVGFQLLTGGGAMSPQTVITNALGEALTKWSVGAVGANTALVVVGTLSPVTLTATGTP
jgi:hypothetical protein